MKKKIKAKVKTKERYINIIIAPSTSGNAKHIKIYYPQLVLAAIVCTVLLTGVYINNLLHENDVLKANYIKLHDLNYAQLNVIKENQLEIDDITNYNIQQQEKVEHLANLYCEIVEKYKEITEKYILNDNKMLASRGDDRDDKNFVTDLISLRNTIMEIQSDLKLQPADVTALSDARMLLDDFAEAIPDCIPLEGRISDWFGERIDPFRKRQQQHNGLDIAAPYGCDIKAAGKGKVVFAGRKGGYGNLVILDHGYGIQTYYAHASRLLVEVDQEVEKGEVIAKVGSTGRSTGPHLHFEVRINDVPIDPLKYITVE